MRRKLLIGLGALVLLLVAGGAAAYFSLKQDRPEGRLDTELEGVSLFQDTGEVEETPETTTEEVVTEPEPDGEPPERCWLNFGENPRRTLALPAVDLRPPGRIVWRRYLGDVLEYPPSFCDGVLYQNLEHGSTVAIDAETGRELWRRPNPGLTASAPAIDGPRVLVSSHGGTVTAFRRTDGKLLWRLRTGGKVESSPVVVDGIAYFGATTGRLFAVNSATGRVRWAYDTGGRINSSPSVAGDRVCISTYAGSVLCVRKANGQELWTSFVQRDALRLDSFYASPSTDGRRVFSLTRSGKAVAFSLSTGQRLWTFQMNGWGYATPAVADGFVYVAAFDGGIRALRAENGAKRWETFVPGRILGSLLVVGNLVFASTLEKKTYALDRRTGRIVWRADRGKYVPGIATDRSYYFSLNASLIKYAPRGS